jgi:hypothetical protein
MLRTQSFMNQLFTSQPDQKGEFKYYCISTKRPVLDPLVAC